jgi:hypothetical protein
VTSPSTHRYRLLEQLAAGGVGKVTKTTSTRFAVDVDGHCPPLVHGPTTAGLAGGCGPETAFPPTPVKTHSRQQLSKFSSRPAARAPTLTSAVISRARPGKPHVATPDPTSIVTITTTPPATDPEPSSSPQRALSSDDKVLVETTGCMT